ncbi:MAG TPA: thiol:disulfide interchange protein DsbA/DsbL [Rhodanobacteraceae bacterium]
MSYRLLLLAPLALALSACGSSGNAPAPAPAPAPQAQATTTATPAATTAPAASGSTAVASSAATTPVAAPGGPVATPMLTAADKAAMLKAAKSFNPNAPWVEGKNYFTISPAQPRVTSTDKIEVVEVFNWGCPACNAAHPIIDKIGAGLPSYATMAYLPAGFRPDENWTLYQRAWYTAKALGLAKKSYNAMFDANWKTGETGSYNLATGQLNPRAKWPDIHTIANFYHKTYGVPAKQFVAIADSFTVNTQMKRADKLVQSYGVPGTPTIIIDGRYRFGFQSAGGYAKGAELAKWLVAKEAKRITSEQAAQQ